MEFPSEIWSYSGICRALHGGEGKVYIIFPTQKKMWVSFIIIFVIP